MALRVPHSKYFRRRLFDRMRHSRRIPTFISDVLETLDTTETARTVAPLRTTNTKAEALVVIGSQPGNGDTLTIGNNAYAFKTALTEVKASGVLTATGNPANTNTVTLGTQTYTFKTALTEVKANGDLVTDNTNAADGSTVVIGSKTYTFESSLTNVDGHIKIGGSADATLLNLARAINASGGTPGTDYATANTVHPTVTSSASVTSHTITLTAKTAGTAGNAIVTTASTSPDSHIDPEGALLTGGVAAVAYEVFIGATASDSLDNLIAAITAGAGGGSTYSTGTLVNTLATAAAGSGDTVNATALTSGTDGNLIAKSENNANLDWDGTGGFLTGGVEPVANEVLRGADAAASLANVIVAITAGAGGGTVYSRNTVAHPLVTAAAATNDLLVTALLAATLGKNVPISKSSSALTLPGVSLDGPMWTATTHGFTDGEGPVLLTSDGVVPAGSPTGQVWVHVINANRIALASSLEALSRGIYVPTTDAGTGTHSLTRSVADRGIFDSMKRNKPRTIAAEDDIDDLV